MDDCGNQPGATSLFRRLIKHWFLLLTLAIGVPLALNTGMQKPLWYDEIMTFHYAKADSLSEVWHLLATGRMFDPPMFYVATRVSMALFGDSPAAFRLPSLIGIATLCVAMYAFVVKQLPIAYGNLGLLYTLFPPVLYYACDGRPYGLWLGITGLALLCWQRATAPVSGKRALALVGLAVCCAAAVATHWYAVLFIFALGVVELWRSYARRRIDFAMWAALIASGLPLIAFWPLIQNGKSQWDGHWAAPRWVGLVDVYSEFFRFHSFPWREPFLGSVFVFVAIAALLALNRTWQNRHTQEPVEHPPFHEVVAAVAMAAIPLYGIVLAKIYANQFLLRYFLPAVCGFTILVTTAAYRIAPGSKWPVRLLTGATAALLVGNCICAEIGGEFSYRPYDGEEALVQEANNQARKLNAILITAEHGFFVQTTFYHPELPLAFVLAKPETVNGMPDRYKVVHLEELPTLGRFLLIDDSAFGGATVKKWVLEHRNSGLRCIAQPPLTGGKPLDLVVADASR